MSKVILDTPQLDNLEKQIKYLRTHGVKVGIFGTKAEEEHDGTKVVEYAFWLNGGTLYMPARPFWDRATQTNVAEKAIEKQQKAILKQVFKGTITGKQALLQLGIYISQRIKEMIISNDYEPLKESTIASKDRNINEILRHHDFLLNSVNFEVVRL